MGKKKREQAPPTRPRSRRYLYFVLVFALALFVRLWHAQSIQDEPFAALRLGDARSYDTWAREIVAGDWVGEEVFYQAPLYPYFLAVVYGTVGDENHDVRVVQSFLGALSCVLVAAASTQLFSPAAGAIAGVLLALYAPAIFFDGLVQKTSLALFLLSVFLFLLAKLLTSSEPRASSLLALGVSSGLLALTRENAIVIIVPVLAWAVVRFRGRAAGALAGTFLVGMVLTLAPVAVRNYAVSGELVLTTSQFGPNLYIGNHEGADGTYVSLRPRRGDARFEREDATAIAEGALGRELSASEVSSYYVERVASFVRDEPLEWLALLARKSVLTFHNLEIVDTEDPYATAEHSPLLRAFGLVFHFGMLAALGVAGIVVSWRNRPRLWPLYLTIGLYWSSVVVFYVFARYRFPLVPLFTLFAAVALAEGASFWKTAAGRERVILVIAPLVMAVVSYLPLVERAPMVAMTHYNWASGLVASGRAEEGADEYRAALALLPSYPEAHNNLGSLYLESGDAGRALDHLQRAVSLAPGYAEARHNLGGALLAGGESEAAVRELREAIRLMPTLAEAHNSLGNALLEMNRRDEAQRAYERALELDPNYANAHHNLGTLLFEARDLEGAKARFEEATRLDPKNAESWNNLGIVLAVEGRIVEAADCFERALRIAPDYVEARRNLERARSRD